MTKTLVLVAVLGLATEASAQAVTVFSGVPTVKVSESGVDRSAEKLTRAASADAGCVISEIAGEYYWATRQNKQMTRHESGAFITFVAVDGSGYVRAIAPGRKKEASLMSPGERQFDYVEHLVLGLGSITYYGVRE